MAAMRAWTYAKAGPVAEVLKLDEQFPRPTIDELKRHEVLVKISYVSLFAPQINLIAAIPHFNSKPHIPEFQFSGEIEAVGTEANNSGHVFATGDKVYGMINPKQPGYNGVLSEYIIAPAQQIVPKPASISMESAAGLAGNGCTVIGFTEMAGLLEVSKDGRRLKSSAEGQKILITGGSTATGQCLIRVCRFLVGSSGMIVTTASPRNTELVKNLGADVVIDYTAHSDLHSVLIREYANGRAFNHIFDISGTDSLLFPNCPSYLKADGCFIFGGVMGTTHRELRGWFETVGFLYSVVTWILYCLISQVRPVIFGGVPRRNLFHSGNPTQRNLILVNSLVEQGVLDVKVDSVWKLADVLQAYDHLANGRVSGKVIIDVKAR